MRRAERLQALTESLRRAGRNGRTAESLSAELEVTTRTVKRDIAGLLAAGLPIWSRTGPGGGYGLAETGSLPPVNLGPSQALALAAAATVLGVGPFGDSARSASRKVLDVVDPATRRRARDLATRVWVDVAPGAPRRVMSPLEQAMLDQRVVNIAYTDAQGRVTRRAVEPLLFAFHHGHWYLVAWCLLRDAVRWFDVGRIGRATVTREPCSGHAVTEIGEPPETARPAAV
ncbi:helix-turn-helix transcriptional regulator [Nocardia alni]|uniref:helix-turn-helix transcriptional regulator n=1 Tax=Nocardia alni TaxID=2815723 RepID=UPI001C24FF2A|nr:WYL domain-containing protein [Nocardia alni]